MVTTGVGGGKRLRISVDNLGTGNGDRAGVYQDIELAQLAGRLFSFSVFAVSSNAGTVDIRLYVDFYDGAGVTGSLVGSASETVPDASQAWTRYALRATVPVGAASARVFVWMAARNTAAGAAEISLDKAQFELGLPTAYSPRADELLAGSVNTTQIAANAATEVYEWTAAGPFGSATVAISQTLSVPAGATSIIATAKARLVATNSGASAGFTRGNFSMVGTNGASTCTDEPLYRLSLPAGQTGESLVAAAKSTNSPAAGTWTFEVMWDATTGIDFSADISGVQLRVEVIKR